MSYERGVASLALLTKWATALLGAFVAVSALGIPIGVALAYAYSSTNIPLEYITYATWAYYAASLIVLGGCIVTIPLWTYRAWSNLRLLGVSGLKRSPGWAAASYFVPIAGLFVPFQAMRELHNRSAGEPEECAGETVPDVASWWACYIAGMLITTFLAFVSWFNTNGYVFIVTPMAMVLSVAVLGNLLLVGAAWFLIRAIGEIAAVQKAAA